MKIPPAISRRAFLATSAAAGTGLLLQTKAAEAARRQALVAITLDLEMSRNFPRWEDVHWDFEKGNLDEATKRYAVEAARRVKAAGGVAHFFLVGQTLEQENVDWLHEIIAAGHSVGSHTYDHVNIKATKPEEIQPRFRSAPWLVGGRSPAEFIQENIRMASAAMKARLGIEPAGFRTPGGYAEGLADRVDVQEMMLELGFKWVSSKYPRHPNSSPGKNPGEEVLAGIVAKQADAQPFVYPSGLIEVPISPIGDIGAFRNGRWELEPFIEATRRSLEWAIDHRAVFDFLCHPSCIGVVDPQFRTIDMICERVRKAGDHAALVSLETVARLPAK